MVTPRIVFFGTPEFAVPSLNALLAAGHVVAGVVTQPDRPRGRGQHLQPSAIKEVAEAHGLPLLQPERLREESFLPALRALNADLGVVAAYGKILTDDVLSSVRMGMINVHASLLPKYRGGAPIHRAVIAGEPQTGVTIMRVVKALDAGAMLLAVPRPIGPDETSMDVELDLASLGAAALVTTIAALSAGTATETPQDDAAATYAHKLVKADGIVDWSAPAVAIHNQIRGLHPWPHAYSDLDGARMVLLESRVEPEGGAKAPHHIDAPHHIGDPGTIVEASGDNFRVQTGDGVLRLLRLQMEGRRALTAREFLAGRSPRPGAQFVRSSS